MLWSKLFIPTLRDNPAEAEAASHRLLLRAGYIRQLATGIYSYLYLAQRSLDKVQRIVREEMDAIGAQEVNLGTTHDDVIAALARGELRSYRQLPQIWYQIQTKFRDEQHPKSGLLRARQFLMKDSCSFDIDAAGLDVSFQKHFEAYMKIFTRCGLRVIPAMGGSQSIDFMVPSEAGEDAVIECPQCRYTSNLEKAVTRPAAPSVPDPEGEFTPEPFHTPGRKTIAEVAEFTGLPPASQMKSLVMIADGKPVLAMLRGDHQLSGTKFAAATRATGIRPALAAEIVEWFGAEPGSLGPVGIAKIRIIADRALEGRRNMIAGANRNDYHLRSVTPGRDFNPEYFDLRQSAPEDTCATCGSAIAIHKTIEAGHIFKLGYEYSESMGLKVDGPEGGEVTPIMGSYGIGIERILCSAIEQSNDANGMILPVAIAPFTVVITPVNNTDAILRETAQTIYRECLAKGIDALYDDRDDRPGVKFKDADLIGIPYRITIGGKKLNQGVVELYNRATGETKDVPPTEAVARLIG
jgi:prolyl-tRNA synthetase